MFQIPPVTAEQLQALAQCVDTFVRTNGVQVAPISVELINLLQKAEPVEEPEFDREPTELYNE